MTDIDFAAAAPPTIPPRHTGTMCGAMVSGGMMSYRCSLIQGHADKPKEDPEPHYAVEVHRSVRAWQDWARRVWELGREEMEANPPIVVGGDDLPVATAKGGEAPSEPYRCMLEGCDYPFQHSHGTDEMSDTSTIYGPPEVEGQRPQVLVDNAEEIERGEIHNPYDSACKRRDFGGVALPNERCMICRPEPVVVSDPEWTETRPEVVRDLLLMVQDEFPRGMPDLEEIRDWPHEVLAAVAEWARATSVHLVASDNEGVEIPPLPPVLNALDGVPPTKQREEDQPLPDGDEDLVDDQQVLIDFIAHRRKIGIERYGQAHRPFNGRDTLQDLFEEQVDLMVYFTSIMRQAQATREDLIGVVTKAFDNYDDGTQFIREQSDETIATLAVERLMGWVTATILLAPEITFDRVVSAVLEESANTVEGRTQGDFAVAVAKKVTGREASES